MIRGSPIRISLRLILSREPPRRISVNRRHASRYQRAEWPWRRAEPSALNAEYAFQCPFISAMSRM